MLGGMRKAYASKGDNMRTRFVKLPTRHSGHVTPEMPADATGTRFKKQVLRVRDMRALLVSGKNNVKIGKTVRKGVLRGYDIFTLSLEERKTCPSSCQHWRTCYGNAMPFAKRIQHDDPEFLHRLDTEIARLCTTRGRKGVLIRLHALGDFYSTDYVLFWMNQLAKHKNLSVYGYTAHPPTSPMGAFIGWMNSGDSGRSMIRFSNGEGPRMNTVSIKSAADYPAGVFICPEQTGKTLGCDTCALCWGTDKTVAFLEH